MSKSGNTFLGLLGVTLLGASITSSAILGTNLKKTKNENEDLKQTNITISAENTNLKESLAEYIAEQKTLKDNLGNCIRTLDLANAELDTTKIALENKTTELNLKQAELESKQTELNTANTNIETLTNDLNIANENVTTLQNQLTETETTLNSKTERLNEVESLLAEASEKNTTLLEEKAQLESEIAELDIKKLELEITLSESQAEVTHLLNHRNELLAQLEEAQSKYDMSVNEYNILKEDMNILFEEKETLTTQINSLNATIEDLNNQIIILNARIQELETSQSIKDEVLSIGDYLFIAEDSSINNTIYYDYGLYTEEEYQSLLTKLKDGEIAFTNTDAKGYDGFNGNPNFTYLADTGLIGTSIYAANSEWMLKSIELVNGENKYYYVYIEENTYFIISSGDANIKIDTNISNYELGKKYNLVQAGYEYECISKTENEVTLRYTPNKDEMFKSFNGISGEDLYYEIKITTPTDTNNFTISYTATSLRNGEVNRTTSEVELTTQSPWN